MALDLRGIFFNLFKPAAPTGFVNLPIQSDGGAPYECISVAAPLATTSTAGLAKPDGTTITVASDGTISAAGGAVADNETVSGSGTSWTLAHAPSPAASLILVQRIVNFGGIVLIAGTDYALSGAGVTTTNSLTSGVLTAWYRY